MNDSWRNMPVGHDQAINVIQGLLEYTEEFKKELIATRTEWQNAKDQSQKIYESIVNDATDKCERETARYKGKCQGELIILNDRKKKLEQVYEISVRFKNRVSTKCQAAVDASKTGMARVEKQQKKVLSAMEEKKQALLNLQDIQIAEEERYRNERINRARTEQMDRETQVDHKYEAQSRTVCENRRNEIARDFGKESIKAYSQEVLSSRFNAASYECPKDIPEYIMLGSIGVSLPMSGREEQSVIQALDAQTKEYCEKNDGEYSVLIPYAQRLSDGISLLMRYTPDNREYIQSMIQPLLLKLFMSFPAGKMEATMIDPLELGASFSDIPKLAEGPNSARIIDTKIWSKEKDIEVAIATLRQRLENLTQAYGGDQESRLKKEVIRTLAITDFPIGFNDNALRDLHAIVRNAASLGVCVLICANDVELNKLKDRNASLVNEITQSVVETVSNGEKLMLVSDISNKMFIKLDDMSDALQRKDTILAMMSSVIEHMQLKIEHFDSMYKDDIYDSNNWFTGNHDEIAIPIGIKGANTIVKMVLGRGAGSTEHHALVAGPTGSGKSTFFHTLILSTMISYSPDEVQMYLLDFKEGVEFSAYTRYRLPSLRVVAINSEREFGLNVLQELCSELETRTKHFNRHGVSDINGYIKLADVPKVPKLLLIFDEVQELFRSGSGSDSIAKDSLSCLNKLVMQGRAMGIHIILACQDFHNCPGLEAYFSQMAIRIAIRGCSVGGVSSILDSGNDAYASLINQPAGAAIYNGGGGVESANNIFQISYIKDEEKIELLERMDAYYTDPDVAYLYEDKQTRVLMTNAEDDIHNCFNQLILNGSNTISHLASSQDGYGLLLGQGFGKKSIFIPELSRKDRDNLLVVTKEEKVALSIFELATMSILYEELHTDADKTNALVYIVDLLDDVATDEECDFDYLETQFPQQVKIAKKTKSEEMLSNLYDILVARSEGRMPSTERIFLLFFGINRANNLKRQSMYDSEVNDEISVLDKLQKILKNGPKNGINTIVWDEDHSSIEDMLGNSYEFLFDKRIAYGLDSDTMKTLVAEKDNNALNGNTAVYMDINTDVKNTHFRPYDIPAKVWVERYAEVYDRIVNGGTY